MNVTDIPENVRAKDWFIKQIATEENLEIAVVRAIIEHQFNSAYENLQTCNSLEFSGFGRLLFNVKKAEKKMQKFKEQQKLFSEMLIKEGVSEQQKRSAYFKLMSAERNIRFLSNKVCEE